MKNEQQRAELSKALGNIDERFLTEDFSSLKMQKKKKLSKNLLILVAMVGVLTAGTYHTGLLPQVIDQFGSIWGGNSRQIEMIQHIGYPVEASATSNGITISADAVMGDENTSTVIFSIGNEDGTPFILPDLDGLFLGTTGITFDSLSSYSSNEYLKDFDPDDGTIQFVYSMRAKEKIPQNMNATASFSGIGTYEEQDSDQYPLFVPVVEGEWIFDFKFKYNDISQKFNKNAITLWENEEIDIQSVTISPFNVRVDFRIDQEATGDMMWNKDWLAEELLLQGEIDHLAVNELEKLEELTKLLDEVQLNLRINDYFYARTPFFVTRTDGTIIDCGHATGGHSGNTKQSYFEGYISFRFEEMIDMDNIQSITYGDYTVEVRQ